MEVHSKEEVDAYLQIQKLDQIQRIEKKMKRLSYEPVWTFGSIIIYAFSCVWLEYESTFFSLIFLAGIIGGVSKVNVERTELLRQLFEIKTGR